MRKYLFFFLFQCCFSVLGVAQDSLTRVDSSYLKLPSLHQVLKVAQEYSPLLKKQESAVSYQQIMLKLARKEWYARLFFAEASYRYGNFNNFTVQQTGGGNVSNFNNIISGRFDIGAGIRLPMTSIINRKQLVEAERLKLAEAQYEQERIGNQLLQVVTGQYHDVLLARDVLTHYNNDKQIAEINLKISEKKFQEGSISISKLATASQDATRALVNYEQAKAKLRNAYLLLEQVIGVKLKDI